MREQIFNDITIAMKNHNKEIVSVLRMIKGAIQLEEINKKRELNDEEIISVINKQIKSRKESIVEFERGNRPDLIDKTNREIEIISKYMPEQISEEEINNIIDEAFKEINPTEMSDMGKVMAYVSPLIKGKADLGIVSKLVKEKLQNI